MQNHACLASQLRTLTQNADAFKCQGQVKGTLSTTLAKIAAL